MIAINTFLAVYVGLYLLDVLARLFLEIVNARSMKAAGSTVPRAFQSLIGARELEKINAYTMHKTILGLFRTGTSKAVFLAVILSGLMPWLAEVLKGSSFVTGGLVFFLVPTLLTALGELPFDYYQIFRVEDLYGFNTRTLRIWASDLGKSCLVTLILGTLLLSLLFALLRYGGSLWWLWAWVLFLLFQLLMSLIYPTMIAPLFNRFTPLREGPLAQRIRSLAEEEGIDVKGVFQMDATRRSLHTNAYLSGLGKAKRIVLFDSLIASHEEDEILAIVSHEIGHLKAHHLGKQIILFALVSLGVAALASEMVTWETMYESFGFSERPLYAGIFLVMTLLEPVGFFLSPFAMAVSRRFEREADAHVLRVLKTPRPLAEALRKMARDNLSNLRPHPLYVLFYDSHPPLAERIRTLDASPEPDIPRMEV